MARATPYPMADLLAHLRSVMNFETHPEDLNALVGPKQTALQTPKARNDKPNNHEFEIRWMKKLSQQSTLTAL